MRYQVIHDIDRDQLNNLLPLKLQERLLLAHLDAGQYNLLLFPTSEHDITISRVVTKALREVAEQAPVVAAAFGLTAEAEDVLRTRGAIILVISEFHWTDRSYSEIRKGL